MTMARDIADSLRWAKGALQGRLSHLEKELLALAVVHKGEVHLLSVNEMPSWVRIGRKDFSSSDDLSVNAKGRRALENLVSKGYLRHETGSLYELTDEGWENGGKYKAKGKSENG